MDVQEILLQVSRARDFYSSGKYQKSLEISLRIREYIDSQNKEELAKDIDQFHHLDGGLNAHIFNCMKLLGQYDAVIPYLEKTLQYLNNDKNPELWRLLGLLYLVKEQNLDKAVEAWRKAIALDESIVQRFPGLNIVYTYDAMKSKTGVVKWELVHADIQTGEFSVSLGTNGSE
jgi:tetratricopeptide (TPR) repeat protein